MLPTLRGRARAGVLRAPATARLRSNFWPYSIGALDDAVQKAALVQLLERILALASPQPPERGRDGGRGGNGQQTRQQLGLAIPYKVEGTLRSHGWLWKEVEITLTLRRKIEASGWCSFDQREKPIALDREGEGADGT